MDKEIFDFRNNIGKNLSTSITMSIVMLFVMTVLLFTPLFEFNGMKNVETDYWDDKKPFPLMFTSDIYPIPLTGYYNVKTAEEGWVFLKMETDEKVSFPRDKFIRLSDYVKNPHRVRLYQRNVGRRAYDEFLLLSFISGLTMFLYLTIKDIVVSLTNGGLFNNGNKNEFEEYRLIDSPTNTFKYDVGESENGNNNQSEQGASENTQYTYSRLGVRYTNRQ